MPAPAKPQILAIDCLRFVCAALVVAYHYLTVFPLAVTSATRLFDPTLTLFAKGAPWTWYGWIGVEIFFVISGYVIATSAARVGRPLFLRRRLLRLVPAAWICASLTAAALTWGTDLPSRTVALRWMASMLFWPTGDQIDPAYWTLGVETAFYLFVSIWLRDGRDNSATIERIGLALGIWSAGFWAIAVAAGAPPGVGIDTPLQLLLLPHGALFALGITLAAIAGRGPNVTRLGIVGLTMTTAMIEIDHHVRTMAGVPGIDADPVIPMLIFAAAVVVIAGARRLQYPLVATLGIRRVATLGLMTYPLYLLNQTLGAGLIAGLHGLGVPGLAATAIVAGVVVVMAWGIAKGLEPAIRRWLAGVFTRPPGAHRALASDALPGASPPAG